MDKTTDKNKGAGRLIDVSLFTRWVNNMDEKDKSLTPGKRKGKWLVILAVLFIAFSFSIFFFSGSGTAYQKLATPASETTATEYIPSGSGNYEMDVDSFEQLLKQHIHEKHS